MTAQCSLICPLFSGTITLKYPIDNYRRSNGALGWLMEVDLNSAMIPEANMKI